MALVVNAGGGTQAGRGTAGGVPKYKRGGTKRGSVRHGSTKTKTSWLRSARRSAEGAEGREVT